MKGEVRERDETGGGSWMVETGRECEKGKVETGRECEKGKVETRRECEKGKVERGMTGGGG